MNQERESGDSKVATESIAPARAERGQLKEQHRGLSGWDIAGIGMGAMIGCLAAWLVLEGIRSLFTEHPSLDYSLLLLVPGVISILLSASLIIPGKYCERGIPRAVGLAVAAFMAGGVIAMPVLAVISVGEAWREINDVAAMGPLALAFVSAVATTFLLPCTVVSLKKLQPRVVETVATIIAGVAVGALLVWLLLNLFE